MYLIRGGTKYISFSLSLHKFKCNNLINGNSKYHSLYINFINIQNIYFCITQNKMKVIHPKGNKNLKINENCLNYYHQSLGNMIHHLNQHSSKYKTKIFKIKWRLKIEQNL